MWFASSPASGMDVGVHVAPGAELDALVRVQTGFPYSVSKCFTIPECVSLVWRVSLNFIPCGMESVCAFPPV